MPNFQNITDRVFKNTQRQIDDFGPRQAGSEAGHKCAESLKDRMEGFADSTYIQDFTVRTGAFLGWVRWEVTLYVLAVIFMWMKIPLVSGGLLLVGIIILVFQFFFYKHFIDFVYPKKTGRNVVGVVEPESEAKQQIIISGHHDSANIFNFFVHQPKLYALRVIGGIGSLFVLCVIAFAAAIIGADWAIMTAAVLGSIGALIVVQLWFYVNKDCTPGAGDNLIASNMAVEMLCQFAEKKAGGKGLKHTRIMAVSFDAEEEGLRGAYAFARENAEMLNAVPTYLYNMDCVYYKDELFFLTSDINNSVKMSEDFAKECQSAGKELGIETKVKPMVFLTGGTDAGELAKVGVKAVTLMGMPWDNRERASVYHTPNDTCDAVEKDAVCAGMEIFYQVVKNKDRA